MSILTKDWNYQTVPASSVSTVSTGSIVTSATLPMGGTYSGTAYPVVQSYPANASVQNAAQYIRLAAASEVAALKQKLFPSMPAATQQTMLNQLLYANENGKPLQVYADGSYIAAWYGTAGVGFYVFLGYNADSYPTQEINVNSIQRT